MNNIIHVLKRLHGDCSAVTALEYALIAALIAGVLVAAVTQIGVNVAAVFTTAAGSV